MFSILVPFFHTSSSLISVVFSCILFVSHDVSKSPLKTPTRDLRSGICLAGAAHPVKIRVHAHSRHRRTRPTYVAAIQLLPRHFFSRQDGDLHIDPLDLEAKTHRACLDSYLASKHRSQVKPVRKPTQAIVPGHLVKTETRRLADHHGPLDS